VIRLATGGLKPDLTLFFDVPIDKAIMRTRLRGADEATENRMDRENIEFYDRVRKAYLKIAENEPRRVRVVDASGPIDEIHQTVLALFEEWYGTGGKA
jgi:dTMP kinase